MHGLGPALFEILELHQQRYIEPVFTLAQVGEESGNERPRRADVAARRRDTPSAGEIGNVGRAMVKFKTESHELAWHVVECARGVPCLELIARVQREVRSAGESGRAIDGRKKHKIPPRISNCTAAQRTGNTDLCGTKRGCKAWRQERPASVPAWNRQSNLRRCRFRSPHPA